MYQIGNIEKHKHRRRNRWLVFLLLLVVVLVGGFLEVKSKLKPATTISQSHATVTKIDYSNKLTHYDEPDFGIDIPSGWHFTPAQAGPYQSYTWQTSDKDNSGQEITVYENIVPPNFAVNRVVIVQSQVTQLLVNSQPSDNCSQYTESQSVAKNQYGTLAKWQNVEFLCNQVDTQRDVVGTSSTDGVNTVILRNTDGRTHKFLFTYSDDLLSPDYTLFTSSLQSVRMK